MNPKPSPAGRLSSIPWPTRQMARTCGRAQVGVGRCSRSYGQVEGSGMKGDHEQPWGRSTRWISPNARLAVTGPSLWPPPNW